MRPQQWILLGLGVVLVVVGSGLLTWASVQRKAHAGVVKDSASLVRAFASLFNSLGKFLGPDPAARAGAFLVVVGLALIGWASLA